MTEESAKQMTWHKNGKRYNPGKMVHPSDAEAWTYFNNKHRDKAVEARITHTCNLCSFIKPPSTGSNQFGSASPGDPAFPSPPSYRLPWWGLVLGDVVGLYCNICGLWFWLVLGFHELVVINMWIMMNMWLVVVIYCDLWFTIMVVIYCEKMGSVWYIYVMVDIYMYIYEMLVSMECKKQKKN